MPINIKVAVKGTEPTTPKKRTATKKTTKKAGAPIDWKANLRYISLEEALLEPPQERLFPE